MAREMRATSPRLVGRALWLSLWLAVGLAFWLAPGRARAAEEPIRLDLRLLASDLVDDVVYDWLRAPPFHDRTALVVAEINAPIGIDQRFSEDIENHLFEVLRANPRLPIQLVHCSLCRQKIAVSNPKRTVIGNALDLPDGQEELARYPHLYALSLHFDAIGSEIALWAEIYEVRPPQAVVWARRYSGASSARAVLREPTQLISIEDARAEQNRIIHGRELFQVATRFPIRTFSGQGGAAGAPAQIQPMIFLEQSVEAVLGPRNNRRAGLALGITSIKDSMQGWSLAASFSQLLFRSEPSLVDPDLYLRAAVTYMRVQGPGAAPFATDQLDIAHLTDAQTDPSASLTAMQIGLEAHAKYRFGFAAFVEYIPALANSSTIATQNMIIPVHSVGFAGVFFW